MAQIASVRRITVVFDVLSVGRVWQAVLVPHALHDLGLDNWPVTHTQGLVEELVTSLLRPCRRQEWMCLSPQNPLDGGAGVEPRRHRSARSFDGGDGGGRGAGDDDVDGLLQSTIFSSAKQLDTVFGLVNAAGLGKFLDSDGPVRVDAALVDPLLDAIQVDGSEVDRET